MTVGSCSVCDREGQVRKGLCDAHYFRLRRTGSVGVIEVNVKNPGARCSIGPCGKPAIGKGLCSMHHARLLRHGDPLVKLKPRVRTGAANNMWRGDEAKYQSVHQRIRRKRGAASKHLCRCGAQAQEWAYQHTDPDARHSEYGPYSLDDRHYEAMCIRCHRFMDGNPVATGTTHLPPTHLLGPCLVGDQLNAGHYSPLHYRVIMSGFSPYTGWPATPRNSVPPLFVA